MKKMKLTRTTWFRWGALLLVLAASGIPVIAARRERLIESWRPVKFAIDLRFDQKLESLAQATVVVTVQVLRDRTREIDLDFGAMPVDAVLVDGRRAESRRTTNRLIVALPAVKNAGAMVEITVKYHGRPADGLIFGHDRDGAATVVGDNWPDRVHNWLPCLDHPSAKAPVSLTVTAPDSNTVVANGAELENHKNVDRTITWKFHEPSPVSPYNIIVGVAPFSHASIPGPVSVQWLVPKYDSAFAPEGFAAAPVAVQQFAETVAPFPYPKLALIVGETKFGGMENAGAIVFPTSLFNNFSSAGNESAKFHAPRKVIDVVAHEIAHQWFGDSVTEATWADLWLSEGFATYFAGLFRERTEGEASFHAYMDENANEYFAYEKLKRTPIHDTETEDLMALLNANNYQKGAWVLHMLRIQLGDDSFFNGLRQYYADHKGGTVTTEDLRAALEKASGKDLKEFFQQWVYGVGHPTYKAVWSWSRITNIASLDLTQMQPDGVFTVPVTVEFVLQNGIHRETIFPRAKSTKVRISLPSEPTELRIDPDGAILKDAGSVAVQVKSVGS